MKIKNKRFIIPLPYGALHLASMIITNKRFHHFVHQATKKDGSKFTFPELNRSDLKPLLHGLSEHKGLILLQTSLKDGTEIEVKL